jgi:predicted Fe-Mo cluster-binding NifX family protein
MTIAISANGPTMESDLDPRFGRAQYYIIINEDTGEPITTINNSENVNTAGGAGTSAAQIMAKHNVTNVISGNFGPNASIGLKALNIKMLQSPTKKIKDIFVDFREGNLKEISDATVKGHH